MPITQAYLEQFHQFAIACVASGTVESFDDLCIEWESRCERSDVNSEISRGLADVDAGRYAPAADVMAEIRREFGLSVE